MNENQTNQAAPKKPLDKKILIIGAVVLVVAIVLIFILVKPGEGGTGGGGTGGGTVNPAEQKIELTGKDLGNGKILVTANSTKTKPHRVDFTISFYDANNEFLRSFDGVFNAIPANGNAYYTVDTAGLVKGKYTFNFEIKNDKELTAEKVYSDKFKSTSTKKENEIVVEFTNNAGTEVDSVGVGILYFNGTEPVGYTSQYLSQPVGVGYTLNETVYIPTDADGNKIKFDRHEVIITAFDNE